MTEADPPQGTQLTSFLVQETRRAVRTGASIETALAWTERRSIAASTELQGAVLETTGADLGRTAPSPIGRIYPHLFDDQGPAGPVYVLIHSALADARHALDAYGDADLPGVFSRLAAIAALMAKAHELTHFNEDYGSVVSFIRRATLTPSPEISRSALNVLVCALKALSENPAIDIDDAAELVEGLANEGWNGDLELGSALLAVLFGDEEAGVPNETQAMLLLDVKAASSQEE